MKAKCIKTDPLQALVVGKDYEIEPINGKFFIVEINLALSEERFNEHFVIEDGNMELDNKSWQNEFPVFVINYHQVRIEAAIAAMQGLCSAGCVGQHTIEGIADESVRLADALIAKLNGKKY